MLRAVFVGQSNGVIRRARRLLTNYTSAPHLSLAAPTLAVSTAPCFADVRRILYENINTPLKLARFMAETPSIGLGETGTASWYPTSEEEAELGGDLEFQGVSFSYPADRTKKVVLSNIELRIPSGCMVGICGRTGCGKTTLLRLLERLYDPTEGTVTLGGCDLRKLDPRWLRQRASFVTSVKDTFVSRTIRCHLGCILLKIVAALLTGLLRGWLSGWGHGA